jgi:nucleoid-associated protein YgaU
MTTITANARATGIVTGAAAHSVCRPAAGSATRPATRPATRRAAQPATQPTVRAVRLTRRGRMLRSIVLGLVLVAAVLVAAVAWGPGVVASSGSGEPVPVRTVTVQPGQTLWDIAAASGLGGDPRDVVARIQDLNALPDAGRVQVGQTVAVPLR